MSQDQNESFGSELRRRRLAAGLSLNALAQQLHYSKGYLSKIETGARAAGPALGRRCDRVLAADGQLVRLLQPAPEESLIASKAALPAADAGDWVLDLMMDGSSQAHFLRRRDLLVGSAISLFGVTAGTPAMTAAAGMESTASSFATMLDELRTQGRAHPPALILPTLVVQIHTLSALARAATPPARNRLLLLASRFAEFTGWMVQESGDDQAMTWWTHRAVTYAEAAGDLELAAYAHIRHANAALYRGDGVTTVELAQRAYTQVNEDDNPATEDSGNRVRALALHRQAQGHALLGRRSDCLRALDQAHDLFDRQPRHEPEPPDPSTQGRPVLGTTTVADPSDLVLGWCLHDLGQSEDAIPILERHLALIPPTARRARARATARLALAHTSVGDVRNACRLTQEALDDLSLIDSATVRHDLRAVARGLSRWRTEPEVQQLAGGPLAAALRSVGSGTAAP